MPSLALSMASTCHLPAARWARRTKMLAEHAMKPSRALRPFLAFARETSVAVVRALASLRAREQVPQSVWRMDGKPEKRDA